MLERKIAFITGAASGIGYKSVQRFSQDPGYNPIYAADINPSLTDTVNHPNIVPVELDVRSRRQVDEVLHKIAYESGRLDIVVNAAGTIAAGKSQPLYELYNTPGGREMMLSLWYTNYHGALYIMKGARNLMRPDGGTIIQITSSKDYFPDPYRQEYERSKHDLEEQLLARADEFQPDNIRVVVVKPGNTKTNIDQGIWLNPKNVGGAAGVQALNNWWRRKFGNDPRNVAEAIYQIAEGNIRDNIVHVGLDAKLGYFLVRIVPGWRHLFFAGSSIVYGAARLVSMLHRGELQTLTTVSVEPTKSGWFEEATTIPNALKPQLITHEGIHYERLFGSFICSEKQLEELGTSWGDLEKYLDTKAAELGNTTMLLDNCKPEPDRDWQYEYEVDKNQDATSVSLGTIAVTYRGKPIFSHTLYVWQV